MDRISQSRRSSIMRAIKAKGSKMEVAFGVELRRHKISHRKNVASLPGKPDVAIAKQRLVVFLDSCFWHGCKRHGSMPATNPEFWLKKIDRNKRRDKTVNSEYRRIGWKVIRFWEHDIKQNMPACINKIKKRIDTNPIAKQIS